MTDARCTLSKEARIHNSDEIWNFEISGQNLDHLLPDIYIINIPNMNFSMKLKICSKFLSYGYE